MKGEGLFLVEVQGVGLGIRGDKESKLFDSCLCVSPEAKLKMYDYNTNRIISGLRLLELNTSLLNKGCVNFQILGLWDVYGNYYSGKQKDDVWKYQTRVTFEMPEWLKQMQDEGKIGVWGRFEDNINSIKWVILQEVSGLDVSRFPGIPEFKLLLHGDCEKLLSTQIASEDFYFDIRTSVTVKARPLIAVAQITAADYDGFIFCDTFANTPFIQDSATFCDTLKKLSCFNVRLEGNKVQLLEPLPILEELPKEVGIQEAVGNIATALDELHKRMDICDATYSMLAPSIYQTLTKKIPNKWLLIQALMQYAEEYLDSPIVFAIVMPWEAWSQNPEYRDLRVYDESFDIVFGLDKITEILDLQSALSEDTEWVILALCLSFEQGKWISTTSRPSSIQWLRIQEQAQLSSYFRDYLGQQSVYLRHLKLSDKLTSLPNHVLQGYKSLELDHIPYRLEKIGTMSLYQVRYTGTSLIIDDNLYYCDNLGLGANYESHSVKFCYLGKGAKFGMASVLQYELPLDYLVIRTENLYTNTMMIFLLKQSMQDMSPVVACTANSAIAKTLYVIENMSEGKVKIEYVDRATAINQYILAHKDNYKIQPVVTARTQTIQFEWEERNGIMNSINSHVWEIIQNSVKILRIYVNLIESADVAVSTDFVATSISDKSWLSTCWTLEDGLYMPQKYATMEAVHKIRDDLISSPLHSMLLEAENKKLTADNLLLLYSFVWLYSVGESSENELMQKILNGEWDSTWDFTTFLPLALSLCDIYFLIKSYSLVDTQQYNGLVTCLCDFLYPYLLAFTQSEEWVSKIKVGEVHKKFRTTFGSSLFPETQWVYTDNNKKSRYTMAVLWYKFMQICDDVYDTVFKVYLHQCWRDDTVLTHSIQEAQKQKFSQIAWKAQPPLSRAFAKILANLIEDMQIAYMPSTEPITPSDIAWSDVEGWEVMGYTIELEREACVPDVMLGTPRPLMYLVDPWGGSIGSYLLLKAVAHIAWLRSLESVNKERVKQVLKVYLCLGISILKNSVEWKRVTHLTAEEREFIRKQSFTAPDKAKKHFRAWFYTGGMLLCDRAYYPKQYEGKTYKDYSAEAGFKSVLDTDSTYFGKLIQEINAVTGLSVEFIKFALNHYGEVTQSLRRYTIPEFLKA